MYEWLINKNGCHSGSQYFYASFLAVVFFAAGFFAAVVFFAAVFFAAGFSTASASLTTFAFGAFATTTGADFLRLRVFPYDPMIRFPRAVFLSPFPMILRYLVSN